MDRTVGNPTAKSAVDMAIWDVIGKTLGQPVTALLGGYSDSMRVSHMLGFAEPAKMVAEAERMRDAYGITTFKVKVGSKPLGLDVDVCRALREELGEDIELYIDGNRGWTPSESLRALNAMADLDLTLAEELCPADDVLGRRWLVERCPVPFVADESATRPGRGHARTAQWRRQRCQHQDSPHRFLALAARAVPVRRTGRRGVMGNQIDGQLGTLCTVTFGAAFRSTTWRAGELSNFLDMSDDLLAEPLEIVDGRLAARQVPGIGIDIDAEKLSKYRLDIDN